MASDCIRFIFNFRYTVNYLWPCLFLKYDFNSIINRMRLTVFLIETTNNSKIIWGDTSSLFNNVL